MNTKEARRIEVYVEAKLGVKIPAETANEILEYTMRKLKVIGQPDGYFPVLYESELHDYFMRAKINLKGERDYVPTVPQLSLQSKLPKRAGSTGFRNMQMV